MNKFLINVTKFISANIIVILIYVLYFELFALNKNKNYIDTKIELFENFISKHKSVNIILGASLIEESLLAHELGNNWFSMTSYRQNIYESYKFLKYYENKVTIDTIICDIQPWNFVYSYVKNTQGNLPFINGNYYHFGADSITNKDYAIARSILNFYFPPLHKLFQNFQDRNKPRSIFNDQGMRTNRLRTKSISKNILIQDELKHSKMVKDLFYNVRKNPNYKYFNTFDSLANKLAKSVIYVTPPKIKFIEQINSKSNNDLWNNIRSNLATKSRYLNFETFKWEMGEDINYFYDIFHMNQKGSKIFTKHFKEEIKKINDNE